MKLKLLILFGFFISVTAAAQKTLTKDSFLIQQKHFPKNYKSIISDNRWQLVGHYKGSYKKIIPADSLTITKIYLFDDGKTYRKIKGNKIVSNSDFSTEKIFYVDSVTLILGATGKLFYRTLYRAAGVRLKAVN